jgi:protein SCO1/2
MSRLRASDLLTPAARLSALAAVILAPALAFSALGGATRGAYARPLPVLGRVADFSLVDQTSAPVSRAALDGQPWLASFVFTRCPNVCPRLSDRMRAVEALARRHDTPLHLVTFSVDPEHDRPEVLERYAEAFAADAATWRFLTGSEESIEKIARSFSVALDGEADPAKPGFGIMHSGHLMLVDRRGRIRGYYPSAEEGVENRIVSDLDRMGTS